MQHIWLYNIDSHLASFSNNACSEWDMDVDAISVNALSREERECHVLNNLCFICHKDGYMSKECPDKKHYKGGSSKESETLQVSVVHGRLGVRIFQEGMH